jgi:hypothetical protein
MQIARGHRQMTMAEESADAVEIDADFVAPLSHFFLLETVPPHAHEDRPPSGAGRQQTQGDLDGDQQQELLALVAVAGDANRDDKRLVESTVPG